VAAPSDEDVARILARVLSQAKKDWAWLENVWPEDDFEELQARAIQERLGLAEPPQRRHHPALLRPLTSAETASPTLVLPTSAAPNRASVTSFGSRFPGLCFLFFDRRRGAA
jgi:hypothetical protein